MIAGSVHLVSSKEFPISTTMTGIIEIVKRRDPGIAGTPNANEWLYRR
ncbi:hypothetical protein M8494_11725 [Serratia ureilytica]